MVRTRTHNVRLLLEEAVEADAGLLLEEAVLLAEAGVDQPRTARFLQVVEEPRPHQLKIKPSQT
jgi:hypothetical protein